MPDFAGQRPVAYAGLVAEVPPVMPRANANILAWSGSRGRDPAERWFRQKASAALLGASGRSGHWTAPRFAAWPCPRIKHAWFAKT